jgi:NitT/TauT family transport system substrate-binding protein
MSMRQDRRTFLKAAGAASAGLVVPLLAACSTSPAPPQTSAAGTTAPATNPSITKVSYAFASPNGFHIVATVAGERPELVHPFGIEFDLLQTTNSPNAVNALVGGSVNVAGATPDSGWPALDKAPDVKQLFAVANGTPYVLLSQPTITKASDLKGKTVGVSALVGGADTTAIQILAAENGVNPTDYTMVQAGAISDRTSAMQAKSIDACANLEPQASLLREAGFPQIDNANNYPDLKSVHSIVLMSKMSWYQGQADLAANFVRAWDALTKWIYDPANKEDVLAISKKTMGGNDDGVEAVYQLHVVGQSVPQNLRITEQYMKQFVSNLQKVGAQNLPSDPMKYVDSSLIAKVLNQ